MQGKLVHQNPDESHSKLFLKAKENKFVLQISQEELPYEIPKYWNWVRLGSITDFKYGRTPDSKNQEFWTDSDGYPWASIADMPKRGYLEETAKKITHTAAKAAFKLTPAPEGSLLMSFKLSIGKTAITKFPTYHNEAIISFTDLDEDLKQYLFWTLSSIANSGNKKSAIKGNTLNSTSLNNLLVPLPPQLEQKRIVSRIEELMSRCDELEKLRAERDQKRLAVHTAAIRKMLDAPDQETFDEACQFITRHFGDLYTVQENVAELRKAILQLAVMGKLVKQDAREGTARELLEDIEREKRKMVKKGKMKEPKLLPLITPEEIPFELPNGWEWTRFLKINTIKSELVTALAYPNEYQIAPDSIEKNTGRLLENRTVKQSGAIGPNNKFYKGQILYSKIRPSLNKVVIASYNGLCSADMYPLICHCDTEFMLKVMLSEAFLKQVRLAENRIKMPKLNIESLGSFVIPLPPLGEQRRISQKIDNLMLQCDTLEQTIDSMREKLREVLGGVMGEVV
ncbi:MAG: restriction endonuclease subunit S [Saprospiraceae bacterium]|nr:restriction endonuclease subunit S [Candidatus Opimibacter iunctus]